MKNITAKVVLLCFTLPAGTVDVLAKRWRDLTPAQSTRVDAGRFAKQCATANVRCQFTLEDSDVMIIFSGGNLGIAADCPNMPAGTVLAVIIKLKRPHALKNFRLKNRKEIIFDPSSPPNHGYKGYYYPHEGFIISSYKRRVIEVVYVAEQKDIHRCSEYYQDPKGFVEVGIYP